MNCLDNISISEDREVICLANEEGIHLYDMLNFQLLIKLNPSRIGLIGDVYKTKIFYNSQIIAFIILETQEADTFEQKMIYNNSKLKRYSLVLYDIKNYEILGKITMKGSIEINDFLITRFFVIIMIENKNKVLLFKTSNFEFFKSISDVDRGSIIYSDDYYYYKHKYNYKEKNKNISKDKINKCIIAYKDIKNKKIVVRAQFIFNEDKTKIIGYKKKDLNIDFNSKELKYIGLLSSYLIVSSAYGNKVHIYDLLSGKFLYCLILGNFPYEISEIHLDNKQKIISIITNNKYLKLYKLNKLNTQCQCNSHLDEDISLNEERGMMDKLKHKMGVGRNDFLCRYKVNIKSFDIKYNKTLIIFDKKRYDSIYVIQVNKNVKKIKFDRKKTKDMIIQEEITLPCYSINENALIINNTKKEKEIKKDKIKEDEK